MSKKAYEHLSDEQVQHFLEHGFLVVPKAFSPEKAAEYTDDLWVRIGYNPEDKTTWKEERLHLPKLRFELAKQFSPKAWGAMCELLGGEERIDDQSALWGDGFILNLGTDKDETTTTPPQELTNWHCDGDFFLHFLDSPEQALLVIPIFSKIEPRGGGTFIAPNSISAISQYLLAHPEGIEPWLGTGGARFDFQTRLKECGDNFVELIGDVGDVILMHPLMMHSASKNNKRVPRIITNPAVSLREPFQFNRSDPSEFSLIELKTLKALGMEKLDFKPAVERKKIVPPAWKVKEEKKKVELQRLRDHAERNGLPVPSICV